MTDCSHLSDEDLVANIIDAEQVEALAKGVTKSLKEELKNRRGNEIGHLYCEKDEPFGTVHIEIGGKDCVFDTAKKVEWNQDRLAAAHHKMLTDGLTQEQVTEYLKIEYGISETAYKSWPSDIRNYFEPARTVKPGSVSIKIKELKGKK